MCAINGLYHPQGKTDTKKIEIMNDVMKHRGPDGFGIYQSPDKKAAFGHRRLAILDLSETGKQPMSNNDGTIWITFNGEIYNYQEFVPELKKKGYTFKGTSDTEAIIYAYEEYGEQCLDLLRGMFAFAIWDARKQKLFIARDRFGEKPLYYATFENTFYFASEIKAILEASKCAREINPCALHLYFTYNFRHVPEPYSIIKGINKLPPAHYLVIENEKMNITHYWKPDYTKTSAREEDLINECRTILKECVNLREVSDVPISALLSGGVDSSTVVAFMNNKKNLKTFSLGFNKNDPELKRARKISHLFKTKNKEILFEEKFISYLPKIISTYGEPYNLMSAIYSYALSKEISKKFKVTLSGNGADELFYGYDGTNGLLLLTTLEKIIPKKIAKLLFTITPRKFTNLKTALLILSSPKNKQKGNLYRYFGKHLKETMYSEKLQQELAHFDEGKIVDDVTHQCNSPSLIERFYHTGTYLENAHSLTIIADTTGMAHAIEIRSPFLDHKLAEFAAKLPVHYKARSVFDKKHNKHIMKKAMEGILPTEILYGKKMGFGYNVRWDELLRTKWEKTCKESIQNLKKTNLFNPHSLDTLFEEHKTRKHNHSQILLGLIAFWMWYDSTLPVETPRN